MTARLLFRTGHIGEIQFYYIRNVFDEVIATYGQYGGKPIDSKYLAEPKNIGKSNETTAEEQAELEVDRIADAKIIEGRYTDVKNLSLNFGSFTDILNLVNSGDKDLAKSIMKSLPKKKTGVMLASPMGKKTLEDFLYPMALQPKLDGYRCRLIVDNGEMVFMSRRNRPFHLPHIEEKLKDVITENDSFILDGELYVHGHPFSAVQSAITNEESELRKEIKLHVYDVDSDSKQLTRLIEAKNIVAKLNIPEIVLVTNWLAGSAEDASRMHKTVVKKGYEGSILRNLNGTYENDKRSKFLIKVKDFIDEEFPIVRLEIGKREEDVLVVYLDKANVERVAKLAGDAEWKSEMLEDFHSGKIKPGDPVTLQHFGINKSGAPRMPTALKFRKDV